MITTSVMTQKRRAVNYVSNKDFLEALIKYRNECFKAKEGGSPRPQIPAYIGTCLLQIATRVGYKPNFSSYSYKEDMISDSYENMCRYILNFDPEKSSNPFAYFTQITHFAYLRRIKLEKREQEKKQKILEKCDFDMVMVDEGEGTDNHSDYNSIKENVYNRLRY
jgi:hypothetical protein